MVSLYNKSDTLPQVLRVWVVRLCAQISVYGTVNFKARKS